jgi:hypothetical protein
MPPRDQRAYNVAYYAGNRRQEIERVRRRQIATVAFLRELKSVPCADCRGRFDPVQMDFDHRDPAQKSFTLAKGHAMLKSRADLLAEVAKCDVVCANCHRVRTRKQHRAYLAKRTLSMRGRTPGLRERWRRNADLLDQLRSVPCVDCGRSFAQCSMEFDHRDPTTKVDAVTQMIANSSEDKLLAEAAKCDIVCANCHRLRTHRRRMSDAV